MSTIRPIDAGALGEPEAQPPERTRRPRAAGAKGSGQKLLARANEKSATMFYGHDPDQGRKLRKAPAAHYS